MEVAARANNWNDLASLFGSSASEIQMWYHSARSVGKDWNTLVGFGNKILTSDAAKVAEATRVDLEGYTNQWQAFAAVMDSLSGMEQGEQMEALAQMGINGPKEAGWLDMLNA